METALLKIHNDLVRAVDDSKGVIVVLLDLSAAFDTLDHDILLTRMESCMGITDKALLWYKSYLHERSQAVKIDKTMSAFSPLVYGVPQGSVLGPKEFSKYTPLLQAIAELYGVCVHMYADDTQLYIPFDINSPDDQHAALNKIEICIQHIAFWMKQNKLKLNEEKTEVLIVCSPRQRHKLTIAQVSVCGTNISPTPNVRNLGAVFDQNLNMADQVTAICRSVNHQLRHIGKIRKYLSQEAANTLVHALVTSRLDNNNALLTNIPDNQIFRLQKLQNNAARVVSLTRKYDHITPVLKQLHWLPVSWRITFKVLLLTYKALHDLAPQYLTNMLVTYEPRQGLRSADQGYLNVPKTKLATYGDRAFSKVAPVLWNGLPVHIKTSKTVASFKSLLKTHLFKNAFE